MGKEPSLEENINQEVEVDFPWVHRAKEDYIFKILFFFKLKKILILFKEMVLEKWWGRHGIPKSKGLSTG